MTDIVERLREYAREFAYVTRGCLEAAADIEHLRARVAELEKPAGPMVQIRFRGPVSISEIKPDDQ